MFVLCWMSFEGLFRGNMPVVEIAVRMGTLIQQGTLPFLIVLPSLFQQEWNDNVQTVREELIGALDRHRSLSNNLMRLHQHLHSTPLSIPDVTDYQFEDRLDILLQSHYRFCGDYRRGQRLQPQGNGKGVGMSCACKKGKQELKDCRNFEEALALGHETLEQGFARKIVFASSNTAD